VTDVRLAGPEPQIVAGGLLYSITPGGSCRHTQEFNVVESLLQQVGDYAETRATLLQLTAADKASGWISLAAADVVVWMIASGTILLLSIATAFLLGEWLGRYPYGFFIMTIAFSLAGIKD
jgi:hypothetical protein